MEFREMAFKCKMCGGEIIPEENASYGTCDSCGGTMTLPRIQDERKTNLFNRANHFRKQNDFDKALSVYESILNEDNTNAEAHWGAMLSRFGIEYVEDPLTHMPKPTCHRVQHDSVLVDADYLAALEYASDSYVHDLYEKEAKEISEIQKGILAISSREKPFDVFICYKESTEGGTRTKDSTIAQDIYYQLTKEDYKVFFARITLEDKLGQEYEPYIFSALNSAKVMLVIGTKPEYFNAVWVKNEWSRYLALAKKDRSRLLIPCYRDMDAYELPEEISFLQSQDMNKVGFIQDIIRGIRKVLDIEKPPTKTGDEATIINTGVEPFLKRAWLLMEDSDWQDADKYFDKILDMDPEFAPAYIGKLCAEKKLKFETDILKLHRPLNEYKYGDKALRFAKGELLIKYSSYIQQVKEISNNKIEEALSLIPEKDVNSITSISLIDKVLSFRDYFDKEHLIYATNLTHRRFELKERIRKEEENKRLTLEEEQERIRLDSKFKDKKNLILLGDNPYSYGEYDHNASSIRLKLEMEKKLPGYIDRDDSIAAKEIRDMRRYQQNHRDEWIRDKLCLNCGGKLSFFRKYCTVCGTRVKSNIYL
jgi:tetratricopeptide (TPR) repeat protein